MDQGSDLSGLSVKALVEFKDEIDRRIEERRAEAKGRLLRELREKAEAEGMSFEEVVGAVAGSRRRTKGRVKPKYRSPLDPSKTWTGRGR